MQNASSALQNSFQDGHPHIEKPQENLKKTNVFSLCPQSSGAPGWGHFRSDLMVYECKTHLRLSRSGKKRKRHTIYANSRSTTTGRPLLVYSGSCVRRSCAYCVHRWSLTCRLRKAFQDTGLDTDDLPDEKPSKVRNMQPG